MRFPTMFVRSKGAGPTHPLLGSDVVPTTPPSAAADNILFSRFNGINGWPCHRVAVVYKAPNGSLALNADMYFYEENIGAWFRVNQASPVSLVPGRVTFFDVVGLLDLPAAQKDIEAATSGSIAQCLIVADPGAAPDGDHFFAIGPDLTTTP